MSTSTGGPAFPAQLSGTASTGLSIRDYFAASAMNGLMTRAWAPLEGIELMEAWAKAAYEVADAMLAERDK